MKKYLSFFRLRLQMGMQYRAAAFAGMATQFFWGFMLIFAYHAFYESNPSAFPMEFSALVSYIWLQQAFLALFITWRFDNDILAMISDGGLAYELARPVSLYRMWFAKNLAMRLSEAALRFAPVLLVAILLPKPWGLSLPKSPLHFLLFLITMVLGLLLTIAFLMIVYGLTTRMLTSYGIRIFLSSVMEFLSGQVIPLPFFPDRIRTVLEFLPSAGMQNVPLRIYSGDLTGEAMIRAILLQLVWLSVFAAAGKLLLKSAEKRAVLQGG